MTSALDGPENYIKRGKGLCERTSQCGSDGAADGEFLQERFVVRNCSHGRSQLLEQRRYRLARLLHSQKIVPTGPARGLIYFGKPRR